jgi:IclR family mhp operon transcriptional activator
MAKYKHNNSIARGLEILTVLNQSPAATVTEISRRTRIHRTTIYRMLDTLANLGYVRRSESDERYHLTLKVRSLSDGFDEHEWVAEIASPVLGKLFLEVLWPTSLATFEKNAMVLRETTHRFSPFSVHRSMAGKTMPVLTSAHGRAYLAFCSAAERTAILANMAASDAPEHAFARDPAYVERIIRTTQQSGYGASRGETEDGIAGLALPVRWSGGVIATLNVVYFASAISADLAVERFLPPLQRSVAEIEGGLVRRQDEFMGELMPLAK